MDYISCANMHLTDLLPNSLVYVIIEYFDTIDYKLVKSDRVMDKLTGHSYCVYKNNIYVYENENGTLNMKGKPYMRHYRCTSDAYNCMHGYKNNIYVQAYGKILVFDTKCNFVHSINTVIYNSYPKFIIFYGKLLVYNSCQKVLYICDMNCCVIRRIYFTSELYLVKIFSDCVYVLTYDEVLYKYDANENLLNKIMFGRDVIMDFHVDCDDIYVCKPNHDDVYLFNGEYLDRVICANRSVSSVSIENNKLYVCCGPEFYNGVYYFVYCIEYGICTKHKSFIESLKKY